MLVFWTLFTKKSPEVKFEVWNRKLSTRQLVSRLLGCSQLYRILKALAKVISEFLMVISQCCQKMGGGTTNYLCLKKRESKSKNYRPDSNPQLPQMSAITSPPPCNCVEGSTGNTADCTGVPAPNFLFQQPWGPSVLKRWEINSLASWF